KGALFFFNPLIVATRDPKHWMLNPDFFLPFADIGRHRFGTEIRGGKPLGLREGVILPGFGGGDRIPALLEAGEAVVPARVVRGGLSEIVAWFRSMGVMRMQDGGIAGILAAQTPREAIALAQSEQESVAREIASFADRMLSGIQEITDN